MYLFIDLFVNDYEMYLCICLSLYLLILMKYICVFDRLGSGDICAGKTFGGKKEESRWGAIVGEGVMDDPRIGGTHRLQDTNTQMLRYRNIFHRYKPNLTGKYISKS